VGGGSVVYWLDMVQGGKRGELKSFTINDKTYGSWLNATIRRVETPLTPGYGNGDQGL